MMAWCQPMGRQAMSRPVAVISRPVRSFLGFLALLPNSGGRDVSRVLQYNTAYEGNSPRLPKILDWKQHHRAGTVNWPPRNR